jgi:4-amino-4-deoxy-L-arabinose transferase-like glycosyltransferase
LRKSWTVLLLAAALYLLNLWGYDLWNPNEPFFGEGAREMLADVQWLVSHINGEVNTHKPPLFFWLIALISLPLGRVTAMTARLPSVFSALGTLALTLRLGRRAYSERTAVLAVVILATSYMFWAQARGAETEALLCFLIWTSLSAFEAWRAGDANGRRAGVLFWAAAGLAVLTKGPVGFLLPLGIALITLATDRSIGRWREFAPFTGPLAFLAITGAWIVATVLWGPPEYSVWGALKEHFIERGIHGMHHVQPWWYFATILPPQLVPWTFLVPGALLLAWRRRDPFDRFLLVTVAFVVVFFSISTEKRAVYVLPAYPAFALLTARLLGVLFGWEKASPISRRWLTVGQAALATLLVLLGATLPFVADRAPEYVPGWTLWALAALLLATGVASLIALLRKRLLAACLVPATGVAAIYVFVALFVYPATNHIKSGRALALSIKEETESSRAAGHPVLACGVGTIYRSFNLYSDGVYFVRTNEPEDLARHLDQEPRVFAVVNVKLLEEIPRPIRERVVIIDTLETSRRDLALIANRPEHAPGFR